MIITIEIPKEFEKDWLKDRFEDVLMGMKVDVEYSSVQMTGNRGQKTVDMLVKAFSEAYISESNKKWRELQMALMDLYEDNKVSKNNAVCEMIFYLDNLMKHMERKEIIERLNRYNLEMEAKKAASSIPKLNVTPEEIEKALERNEEK